MSNYIFLTKNFPQDGERLIYSAISDNRIETLNLCDTYGGYGQQVGHYDTGDYHMDNSGCDAVHDCKKAISEKFGIEYNDIHIMSMDRGDYFEVEAGDGGDYGFDEDKVNEFIKEWRKENECLVEAKGFNYWDGHNWRTIITSTDSDETSHSVLYDEQLTKELNEAIENKDFEKEGHGVKTYRSGNWVILDSAWQGEWAEYDLISVDEYEMSSL